MIITWQCAKGNHSLGGNVMAKILISPSKYVQGAGELKKLGEYAGVYGKKALILISAGGQKRSGKLIEDSFAAVDTAMEFAIFNGECSKTEIQRLQGVMQASGCDMIIGIILATAFVIKL